MFLQQKPAICAATPVLLFALACGPYPLWARVPQGLPGRSHVHAAESRH